MDFTTWTIWRRDRQGQKLNSYAPEGWSFPEHENTLIPGAGEKLTVELE